MQNYKKIYLNYFGYGEQEACQNEAVDVHHIWKERERMKLKIAWAHSSKVIVR